MWRTLFALLVLLLSGGTAAGQHSDPGEVAGHAAVELDLKDQAKASRQIDESAEAPGVVVRLYWKNGLNYRLEDQLNIFDNASRLTGRIGLRLQIDGSAYAGGEIEGTDGGGDIRRFYFYTTGKLDLVRPVLFKLDLGQNAGKFFIEDAYFWVTDLPWVGTAKFGQFTAPMSLAKLTSSNSRPFMEVGSPVEAFSPGSKAGVQLANAVLDSRATWAFGVFSDTFAVPDGDASSSRLRVVTRTTGLPIWEPAGEQSRLLHLGASASYVFSSELVQYRARPGTNYVPFLVDTGAIEASGSFVYGLEAAWVEGPITLAGEFLGASVSAENAANPNFYGLYASAVYSLTGETRPYDRLAGVFGAVEPREPIDLGDWSSLGNWEKGAWELAARTSWIDLASAGVEGGRMISTTFGLNWIWNREIRWLMEYGHANAHGGPQDGKLHTFQVRLQILI